MAFSRIHKEFVFLVFKRLAYMLTANCYMSKSVTQQDAWSKRYLCNKISCQTNRTQNNSDRYQIQNVAKGSNCLASLTVSFCYMNSAFVWIIHTCTQYFEFLIHAISKQLIALCEVSVVEAIKYQNKDAKGFSVLTVLLLQNKVFLFKKSLFTSKTKNFKDKLLAIQTESQTMIFRQLLVKLCQTFNAYKKTEIFGRCMSNQLKVDLSF